MAIPKQMTRSVGLIVGVVLVIGLTGCDYWPPALQAQIEQLRSETQTLTMEKAQLQSQVADLTKARQDLQLQIDDLGRVNREKTGMITSLQNQVEQLRAHAAKASAPKTVAKTSAKTSSSKTTAKAAAKPLAKPVTKQPAKKKATASRM
jgi:uncharacterized protein HemX